MENTPEQLKDMSEEEIKKVWLEQEREELQKAQRGKRQNSYKYPEYPDQAYINNLTDVQLRELYTEQEQRQEEAQNKYSKELELDLNSSNDKYVQEEINRVGKLSDSDLRKEYEAQENTRLEKMVDHAKTKRVPFFS